MTLKRGTDTLAVLRVHGGYRISALSYSENYRAINLGLKTSRPSSLFKSLFITVCGLGYIDRQFRTHRFTPRTSRYCLHKRVFPIHIAETDLAIQVRPPINPCRRGVSYVLRPVLHTGYNQGKEALTIPDKLVVQQAMVGTTIPEVVSAHIVEPDLSFHGRAFPGPRIRCAQKLASYNQQLTEA